MAEITTTEAAPAIPEFWLMKAIGRLRAATVMTRLVTTDFSETEISRKGDTVNVTKRGDVTVRDKAEGTDITSDAPSNTGIAVVLDKHKYVSWTLEDNAGSKAIDDAVNYVQDAMDALIEAVEGDLLNLYSDVAADVGVAGNDISDAIVLDARKVLNDQKAPATGRNLVVSSKDDRALLAIDKLTDPRTPDGAQALREAALGRYAGFDIYMSQLVKTTAGPPTTTHNLAFHKNAFYLVTRPLALPDQRSGVVTAIMTDPVTGITLRYSRQYSIAALATVHVIDILYGVKSVDEDRYAVEVLS